MRLRIPIDKIGIVLLNPQIMKLHPAVKELIAEIEAFRGSTGMPVTTFGLSAAGDPNFIKDIKAGRMPNLRLIDRVRAFMQSQSESAA